MSDLTFAQATAVRAQSPGSFIAEVPDGWQQGRGAYGGFVLGALLRAILASEADPARLTRTLTGDLCGPVMPGPAQIETTALRRGNNLSNWQATLHQNGELLASCTATLSAARKIAGPPVPVVPPVVVPQEQALLVPPDHLVAPPFVKHFIHRNTGPMPFAGAQEARTAGWLRLRQPISLDAPAMIGMLDAWWPALLSICPQPHAMSTASFTAQMLQPLRNIAADEPLYYTAQAVAGHEGFVVELRTLWQGATPVAMNQQTFVVLK